MTAIKLALDIPCTREEAARFAAVQIYLHDYAGNPAAQLDPDLGQVFGENARDAILAITGYPEPLGVCARFDAARGMLSVTDEHGRPNLAALPVLLLWLYPDKLPIAYAVHAAARPAQAVWTIVGMNRVEITQDATSVDARIAALRADPGPRRRDLLPTRPLPNGGD